MIKNHNDKINKFEVIFKLALSLIQSYNYDFKNQKHKQRFDKLLDENLDKIIKSNYPNW